MITIKKQNKLNELSLDGYKQLAKTQWGLPENVEAFLQEHEFKLIGEGDLSKVFQSNTENFVVKVNKGEVEKEYSDFIDCCRNNSNNPHLPKFGKMRVIQNNNIKFYIVFIEKLKIISGSDKDIDFKVCELIDETWKYIKKDYGPVKLDDIKEYMNKFDLKRSDKFIGGSMFDSKYSEQFDGIIKAVIEMSKYLHTEMLDLYTGNMGFRDNTIVILDPVRETED